MDEQIPEDIRADHVTVEQGGAGSIQAETVTINQGGAQTIHGTTVEIEQGGAALITAEHVTATQSGAAIIVAEEATIVEGFGAMVFGTTVNARSSQIGVLVAGTIEGEPDVRMDARLAAIIGAAFAITWFALRKLFR